MMKKSDNDDFKYTNIDADNIGIILNDSGYSDEEYYYVLIKDNEIKLCQKGYSLDIPSVSYIFRCEGREYLAVSVGQLVSLVQSNVDSECGGVYIYELSKNESFTMIEEKIIKWKVLKNENYIIKSYILKMEEGIPVLYEMSENEQFDIAQGFRRRFMLLERSDLWLFNH